jgi:hypothetical protein
MGADATAVTRLPIGTILADSVTRALFRGKVEEVEAVAPMTSPWAEPWS